MKTCILPSRKMSWKRWNLALRFYVYQTLIARDKSAKLWPVLQTEYFYEVYYWGFAI